MNSGGMSAANGVTNDKVNAADKDTAKLGLNVVVNMGGALD